jgi:hypothetical protein
VYVAGAEIRILKCPFCNNGIFEQVYMKGEATDQERTEREGANRFLELFCDKLTGDERTYFTGYFLNAIREAERAALRARFSAITDPFTAQDRDMLGRQVRNARAKWAKKQSPWIQQYMYPYENMSEQEREMCREIGEHLFTLGVLNEEIRQMNE